MFKTAPINIRTHPRIKKEAQKVAEALGLNLSSVIDAYLRQFIRTKEVYFSLESEQPSKNLLEAIQVSESDYRRGDVISFDRPNDALAFLDPLTKKSKKKRRKV